MDDQQQNRGTYNHEHDITDDEDEDVGGELDCDAKPAQAEAKSEDGLLMHLLKQLTIGADLTRITLPTYVLEARSLLELFADNMGNPYLLLALPDILESPQERMYQVTLWYLTSFYHANSSAEAKKPYNATLGETFECSWDLKSDYYGITTFVGEQVSHHPPVSAFYFENRTRGLCLNGHIWTKSKFYGNSVGSVLVGKSSLYLLGLNEEYEMTYPSCYARSIFTTPKMEFGGGTYIFCKKTGYRSDIVFKSKPMFGGTWHEISCTIKDGEGNVKFAISGTWNGTLRALCADDKVEREVFNSKEALRTRKRVKPMHMQKLNESRKKWEEVTRALKANNIKEASDHKHSIEERQRSEARERERNGDKWVPVRFFWNETTERWVFKNSLALEHHNGAAEHMQ
eukprot:Nk52_evm3s161 gene=Nk52_evmTU3s161